MGKQVEKVNPERKPGPGKSLSFVRSRTGRISPREAR